MEYERINPRNMTFEYMMPSSYWTEDTDFHCLLIDLPGFKNEEVRIRDDSHGNIIVSGERQASDTKTICFEQSFKVPERCKIEDTSGILEDQTFYLTIPKYEIPNEEIPQVQNSTSADEKDESVSNDNSHNYNEDEQEKSQQDEEEKVDHTSAADEWSERSLLHRISRNLMKNRCIFLTAFLSFSLGVAVSHRFQTTAEVERSQ